MRLGFFWESLIKREAIPLRGDTATTTTEFKNPSRRKMSVLRRVKMYKSYQYQPLSGKWNVTISYAGLSWAAFKEGGEIPRESVLSLSVNKTANLFQGCVCFVFVLKHCTLNIWSIFFGPFILIFFFLLKPKLEHKRWQSIL